MKYVIATNKSLLFLHYVNLKLYSLWDKNWVDYVRVTEGISEITDDHQKVIEALRGYYKRNGTAPMIRIMSMKTGYPLKRIYKLFPSDPGKGACKMTELTPIS